MFLIIILSREIKSSTAVTAVLRIASILTVLLGQKKADGAQKASHILLLFII
jgi:hypothetical protein